MIRVSAGYESLDDRIDERTANPVHRRCQRLPLRRRGRVRRPWIEIAPDRRAASSLANGGPLSNDPLSRPFDHSLDGWGDARLPRDHMVGRSLFGRYRPIFWEPVLARTNRRPKSRRGNAVWRSLSPRRLDCDRSSGIQAQLAL